MSTTIRCPCCGHVFMVGNWSPRAKRLMEIVRFIEERRPTVDQCIIWIMKKYKVRREKAIEYIRDLALTGEIKVENHRLLRVQR